MSGEIRPARTDRAARAEGMAGPWPVEGECRVDPGAESARCRRPQPELALPCHDRRFMRIVVGDVVDPQARPRCEDLGILVDHRLKEPH